MSYLDKLKNNRDNLFNKVKEEIEKQNSRKTKKYDNEDARYWQPTVDEQGNGYAVIRFLPCVETEDVPYVTLASHSFQDSKTGNWYIENSLSTLGKPDPVIELNYPLWKGSESDIALARERGKKVHFISNILVVSDKEHPENEGKVFLYKYGKKIFDKVNSAMTPEFEDEVGWNPFDIFDGADFKLKIRKVDKRRNYDKSEFSANAPITLDGKKANEKTLERILGELYPLQPEVGPDKFKTYEELTARLNKVLGLTKSPAQVRQKAEEDDASWANETPAPSFRESNHSDEDEEDVDEAFFKNLSK
jgi:hypothetical protein